MKRIRRPVGLAAGGALVLSLAALTAPAQAAPHVDTPVATTQLNSVTPLEVRYLWAGASGFEYALGAAGNGSWVDYPCVTPPEQAGPDDLATGTDVWVSSRTTSTITLKHRSKGVTASVALPGGQTYVKAVGWSVLSKDAGGALHVLRPATDGGTTDTAVTGVPAGAQLASYPAGGSVARAAVVYTLDGTTSVGLLDLADGSFRTYLTDVTAGPRVAFNDRWLVANTEAIRVDAEPGTEPAAVHYPARPLAVVGDQLLSGDPDFISSPDDNKLTAVSLTTGAQRTVLKESNGGFGPTLDGGLLAAGGTTSSDWHVYRVQPTADGDVSADPVFTVPPTKVRVDGLMMAGGELLMYGNAQGTAAFAVPLDTAGKPTGEQVRRGPATNSSPCLAGDAACPQVQALGDGRYTILWTGSDGKERVEVLGRGDGVDGIEAVTTGDAGGRVTSASGRYVLYNGGSAGVQKVADFPGGKGGAIALDRTRTAAAVWGQRVWTPGTTNGSIVAYDLKAKKNAATVNTGAPCTPSDIQAVDTWLYWSCGASGPAGVYDRAAGRAITVPSGQVRLADGYLLREDRTTHVLSLTDFHTGTAVTRNVAVLPSSDQNTGGDTGRWTVDRFGGNLAYLTSTGQVAVVTAGVPTTPLAQMEAQTEAGPGPTTADPWQPAWQLSKPSTWTLKLSNSSGTAARTLTGDSTAASVRPSWNGQWDDGRRVSGTYTWQLVAKPRDGQGPDLTLTGTTTVS